ncbi:phosphoribosylanthranilate isomerase [Candidatus Deferrimicrobium sp.]|uniref:phosphoribosylanthranilate isomerase n=1 Tax=Candidatus Deferrimicrobium sp. TaxID=3060586 RepID=UPI00272022E7|nr:phosphoribosylanthranilate isomerase [Candidatus Deferrimicrobium sp.]MDO8738158.1 phosphoribosylanthranilate isomerase [Candidatus Deferrimicrobium sp.]
MFRIKICGVTRPEDAAHAVACGAEAIGINFFPGSPRFVPTDIAREIVGAVADRAVVVGVFVNEAPGTIVALCERLGIRRVQLHGDEPPGDASRIPFWRMKAVHADRIPDLPALLAYPCEAFLFDAGGKGAYGGTGRELAWGGLGERFPGVAGVRGQGGARKPWLLAGGLTPENVERAILAARPFGVDVASGVESSPGRKDPGKVKTFIERAKAGFRIAET